MSNEFNALRARARDKRDKAINHARQEYEATLVTIASLEQDLLGRESSRHKMVSACIESVIPREASFNTLDILTSLEALDPGRVWRRRSIDNHISRLRDRGLVRRIKRATTREPASYVRADSKEQGGLLADKTLLEVIGMVLDRPMTATEVVVAVVEAGYQSTMSRKMLRNHVGVELKRGGFTNQGGKWAFAHASKGGCDATSGLGK